MDICEENQVFNKAYSKKSRSAGSEVQTAAWK